MTPVLTKKDIRRVARRIVETLEQGSYRCCLFGSAACLVWGMDRVPEDIDVVVFSEDDPEDIKAYLAEANSRCYLEDSANPNNTYKKVYYSLSWRTGLNCKVDILTAGRTSPLHIPKIPSRHVQYVGNSDIPVLPFSVLLILKVQGWHDHRISNKPHLRVKIPQDRQDIEQLLTMLDDDDHLDRFNWLPQWFVDHAADLIEMYTEKYPSTAASFRDMGFDV
ncbi:hypothetical protein APHAL10511_003310 [Amanita phalloides]|nr:hypothetical protein APHAL10511_003310 [Amanita phalloides]